jgi:hypothetical protein
MEQQATDTDIPVKEGADTFGEARKAKTRITLTFTVTNPVEETNKWSAQAIFGSAARSISFLGGKDIVLEGIGFDDLTNDNSQTEHD